MEKKRFLEAVQSVVPPSTRERWRSLALAIPVVSAVFGVLGGMQKVHADFDNCASYLMIQRIILSEQVKHCQQLVIRAVLRDDSIAPFLEEMPCPFTKDDARATLSEHHISILEAADGQLFKEKREWCEKIVARAIQLDSSIAPFLEEMSCPFTKDDARKTLSERHISILEEAADQLIKEEKNKK